MMIKKQKYKTVHTNLDEEEEKTSTMKNRLFTRSCVWTSLRTTVLISIYFAPSIGLTFYQRWLYQTFHFPLTVVLIHLVVKYLLAALCRTFLMYRQKKPQVIVNWKSYVVNVGPAGIFSGIDIGFSNWGLELVTVSLYTMTKSTTIVFILGFAILFQLEKKSWSLSIIVIMISFGLFLFTYEATQFNIIGFILVLLASMSSGVRWTYVQVMLQKSKMGITNPIDMIYYMQPWMIVSILPFAIWMEGEQLATNCQTFRFTDYTVLLDIILKSLVGAFMAFFMETSEVMVVAYTSSLTLSIAGIFKEMFILVVAVEWNGDRMSFINVIGLFVCLIGITIHVLHKLRSIRKHSSSPLSYDTDSERFELSESLIDDDAVANLSLNSESDAENSDSQVLFNILSRHDR